MLDSYPEWLGRLQKCYHMPLFDWNRNIVSIPDAWRSTHGANVKIAVLDSGVDLLHPGLQHLDRSGRKFDVAQPGFDPDSDVNGTDDVTDGMPSRRAHGTQCISILAAQPVNGDGVLGICSHADIYCLKVIDAAKDSLVDYFVKGMQVAIREGVDIVSVSYFPLFRDPVDRQAIEAVMRIARQNRILIIGTLLNTKILGRLNELRFPSDQSQTIVTGVIKEDLLRSIVDHTALSTQIAYLWPQAEAKYCTLFRSEKYLNGPLTSSYATAGMTGLLALLISHLKRTEANYQRRTKDEIMDLINPHVPAFDRSAMLSNPSLQPYKVSP